VGSIGPYRIQWSCLCSSVALENPSSVFISCHEMVSAYYFMCNRERWLCLQFRWATPIMELSRGTNLHRRAYFEIGGQSVVSGWFVSILAYI
jgi:hypothetical protein